MMLLEGRLMQATKSILVLLLALGAASVAVGAPDLSAVVDGVVEASLDFDRTVDAGGLELPLDHGLLHLERGVLVPARLDGDERVFEWVFVGHGRLRVLAPDEVEAQQLFSFTGKQDLDTSILGAVLITGDPALSSRLLGRGRIETSPETTRLAKRWFEEWTVVAGREGFGADEALVRAIADDPVGRGFFGMWFDSSTLGHGFYVVDPSRKEPVRLGGFELFEDDDFKSHRMKKRERREARIWSRLGGAIEDDDSPEDECGIDADEEVDADTGGNAGEDRPTGDETETFEWIEVWLSSSRPGADPGREPSGVEPEHYRIELTLSGDDLRARGTARIRLRADRDGLRILTLRLGSTLDVCSVRNAADEELEFGRHGQRLLVALTRPTVASERLELTVEFAGKPIGHWLGRRPLLHTGLWHPHAGVLDRATYDVTLRWPERFSVSASGVAVENGVVDGQRYTHQTLDVPAIGFSFEIDEFEVLHDEVGHLELTFAFHDDDPQMTEEIRTEIVTATKASLLYFETHLGLLPVDQLNVVIVRRGFSQGYLGFVTLAEGAIHPSIQPHMDNRTRQEVRLETIAHEISHQWWGNVVGWDSYRDQWLSEALAEYSAANFMATIAERPESYLRKRAEMWRVALKSTTLDGRPLGSLGPVVLGGRLYTNHGGKVYQTIVYEKGSAVFGTLAQQLGSTQLWQMLGSLAKAVNNRVIRTATFLAALERMSGKELDSFASRYVYGSGLPAVFYDHRFAPEESGGWLVEGRIRQLPPEQFRYVLRRAGPGWDVVRQFAREVDVSEWEGEFPFYVETLAQAPGTRRQALGGDLTVRGATSSFSVPLSDRPIEFRLDPAARILADLVSEAFEPKRFLYILGDYLGRLGRLDQGLETLKQALSAERTTLDAGDRDEQPAQQQELELDTRIHLARARLALGLGNDDEARRSLKAAEKLLPRGSEFYAGERAVLAARLDLRAGHFGPALDELNGYIHEHAAELASLDQDQLLDDSRMNGLAITRGEVLAMLAVASHEMGDKDSAMMLRVAEVAGVDMSALREALRR